MIANALASILFLAECWRTYTCINNCHNQFSRTYIINKYEHSMKYTLMGGRNTTYNITKKQYHIPPWLFLTYLVIRIYNN